MLDCYRTQRLSSRIGERRKIYELFNMQGLLPHVFCRDLLGIEICMGSECHRFSLYCNVKIIGKGRTVPEPNAEALINPPSGNCAFLVHYKSSILFTPFSPSPMNVTSFQFLDKIILMFSI